MVMQKIVDLHNGRLLMVKVPKGAQVELCINFSKGQLLAYTSDFNKIEELVLPSDNWQLLGRQGKIAEEKARTIVEGVGDFHSKLVGTYPESYWDYESNELLSGFTATKSLQSLITSNGFNPDETVLLFESPEIKEL